MYDLWKGPYTDHFMQCKCCDSFSIIGGVWRQGYNANLQKSFNHFSQVGNVAMCFLSLNLTFLLFFFSLISPGKEPSNDIFISG